MKQEMQATLRGLIKEYAIEDIEKHLIYQFAKVHQLDVSRSQYLADYFGGYDIQTELLGRIGMLENYQIEDLADDMGLLMPVADKQVNGAFFTPSYIVDFIVRNVQPSRESISADMSCGCGAFILGLLRYYTSHFGYTVSESLPYIFGGDIIDYNVRRCKLLVMLYGLMHGEVISEHEINISQGDSLKRQWGMRFDIIVGNPPYVKFQDLDEDTRAYLFKQWETTKQGTYNLYFAFFELGLKLLTPNGRLGYITPNNYFTSLSGEPLRAFFQSKQCIYSIIDFNCTKVFDVQTYTAITFVNKDRNQHIGYARIDDGMTPNAFLKQISLTMNEYTALSVKKWRLLCGEERQNIYAIEHSGSSLKTLFDICVGIATLKDDAYTFVPSKEDEKFYYVTQEKPYKIEKEATRPLVKISDVKCQQDLENNKKRIIFPYYLDKENRVQLIEEPDFRLMFPCCYEYLLAKRDILANRGKGNHVYEPFYKYGRTQTMNKKGKKLLTPTFSQYPRFLVDNTSEGLFTNGYGIYPRTESAGDLFGSNPIGRVENFDVVQKILNSCVMHYYVKKTSVSIEGGYPCYQKNFIERFTIPDFTEDEITQLRSLKDPAVIDDFLMRKYQVNLPTPNRC